MLRTLALALVLAGLPLSASAATLEGNRTIVLSEPQAENVYLAGTDITIVAPLAADLMAIGTGVKVDNTVAGDVAVAGGTVGIQKQVAGDVRIIGAHISVDAPVAGDLIAAGVSVVASTTAKDTRLAGLTVNLTGAGGPVVIYGSDVQLAGDFAGDVTVVASNKITITDGTHIHGALKYNAPEQITVPPTAVVDGAVTYVGSAQFLPTTNEAHTFAIAGATILFIAHLLAILILAGLMAGFFPEFTEEVAGRVIARRPRRLLLLTLLGFALTVATPVLILALLLSFAGIGVALLLIPAYLLLLMLGYIFAGIAVGAVLSQTLLKRHVITWKEAVFGTLVLYLIGTIPAVGFLVKLVLIMATAGAIASIAYIFAFKREQEELPL